MGSNPARAIRFGATRQTTREDHERIIRVGCVAASLAQGAPRLAREAENNAHTRGSWYLRWGS